MLINQEEVVVQQDQNPSNFARILVALWLSVWTLGTLTNQVDWLSSVMLMPLPWVLTKFIAVINRWHVAIRESLKPKQPEAPESDFRKFIPEEFHEKLDRMILEVVELDSKKTETASLSNVVKRVERMHLSQDRVSSFSAKYSDGVHDCAPYSDGVHSVVVFLHFNYYTRQTIGPYLIFSELDRYDRVFSIALRYVNNYRNGLTSGWVKAHSYS